MKKMRKFAEGGFSAAQEEWLGGADRTDPYILARMRSAVPDEVAKETTADNDPYGAANKETSADLDPYGASSKAPVTKTVTKSKVSVTKPKYINFFTIKNTAPYSVYCESFTIDIATL